MEVFLFVLGRCFIGFFFIWKAVKSLNHWKGAVQGLRKKKVAAAPFVLTLATLAKGLGGLSILLGFLAHWGAAILCVFMVIHMCYMHTFWYAGKGEERKLDQVLFMKDLAILGALLMIAVIGSGPFSLYL